jgi:hypothetical protein
MDAQAPGEFLKGKTVELIVKYKGKKPGGMPVTFPIGCKSAHAVKKTVVLNPFAEMAAADARKLVALDPHNFELVDLAEVDEEVEIELPEKKVTTVKRRGRKKKPQPKPVEVEAEVAPTEG